MYRCTGCGLMQANHASIDPALLHDYYRVAYAPAPLVRKNLHFQRRAAAIVAVLKRHMLGRQPEDIFEVGAGDGITLHALAANFPGTRLSTDEPRSTLDAGIERQNLEDHPRDAVVMSHVLEHLPYPLAFLTKLQPCLKHGGILYIEVPNGTWQPFRDVPFDEPHISFFGQKHLAAAIARTNGLWLEALGSTGPAYWWVAQGAAPKNLLRFSYDLYNAGRNLLLTGQLSKVPSMRSYAKLRTSENGLCLRAIVQKP